MRKRGFTLVELLVVIAIIAILAAMIAPVLLEAKEAAKMKRCVGNIKQLGAAVIAYMDDNNGYGLPIDRTPSSAGPTVDNPWVLFVKPLQQYIGQVVYGPKPASLSPYQQPRVIYVCSGDICRGPKPTDNDRPCWWAMGSSYMYPGTTAFISRSANDTTGDDLLSKHPSCVALKPMTWRVLRRDLMLADFWSDYHSGYKVQRNYSDPGSIFLSSSGGKRDVRCINVMFLDGHAAAVTPEQRDDLIWNVRVTDNPYYVSPP